MKIPTGEADEAKFEMAPMIDMVFLLLVFFMCASRISVMKSVPLEIPTAVKAVVPKDRPHRFVINITADGGIWSGATHLGTGPDAVAQVKDIVSDYKEAVPGAKIYLRADQKTKHKQIKKVMAAMAELGIDDFIFGAYIPE
jgi:biopolymer transport protein ExbD